MKFAEKLEAYGIAEWAEFYVRYKALKKFLKRHKNNARSKTAIAETNENRNTRFSLISVATSLLNRLKRRPEHIPQERSLISFSGAEESLTVPLLTEETEKDELRTTPDGIDGNSATPPTILYEFLRMLDKEILKVENHFMSQKQLVLERLAGVENEIGTQNEEGSIDPAAPQAFLTKKIPSTHRKRLQKALLLLWEEIDNLDAFINMNIMAVYKILKKRDKFLKTNSLWTDLTERKDYLAQLTISPDVENRILKLFQNVSDDYSALSGTTKNFYALVQKDIQQRHRINSTWISFFLGIILVSLVDIAILSWLPASNPHFLAEKLLTILPIYRFILMIVLFLWGLGAAMSFMDTYGVNYNFILDVDPKCSIKASTVFTLAAMQSILWVFSIGLLLADYKFLLFGSHDGYWLHPLLLLITEALVLLIPSSNFRNKYKRDVIKLVFCSLKSCFFPFKDITLAQNLVGDVFTSLSKPMGDAQRTICYFWNGTVRSTCPSVDAWIRPLIFGFPYYLRFMQILGRYRGDREGTNRKIHLANMFRYIAGMAVIACTSIRWENYGVSIYTSRLIWVFSYIFATSYMVVWDVFIDWNLMPDPDHFIRPGDQMLFPRFTYYFVATTNLLCRFTWAMTLMPIALIDSETLNASFITFFISAVEIYRRCSWLVLRLENEHLTNSSRYRSVLWVPRKYT